MERILNSNIQHRRIQFSRLSLHSTGSLFGGLLLLFSLFLSSCANLSTPVKPQPAASPTLVAEVASALPTVSATQIRSEKLDITEKIDPPEKTTPARLPVRATEIAEGTPTPVSLLVRSDRPPHFTSDLLFISEDRLLRWDHLTNYGVILAENVVDFSTGALGKSIILLRKKGVAANGVDLFDLDILEFGTKQIRHLIEDIPDIEEIVVSPDGRWLAYYQPSQEVNILAFRVTAPGEVISLGSCLAERSTDCRELAWSPDSINVLWIDKQGIWIADPGKNRRTNLNPGVVKILDPKGMSSDVAARFSTPRWSPTGRFALVRVYPEQSEVRWQSVLDTRTGKTVQVFDSYETGDQLASLIWLADGALAVVHGGDTDRKTAAALKISAVVPTSTEMLISGREYPFRAQELPAVLSSEDVPYENDQPLSLEWLQPIQARHVSLGIRFLGTTMQPILFDLNLENGELTQIAQVAADTQEVIWSPDGSGFLLCGPGGSLSFVQSSGGAAINLQPFAGKSAHSFVWLAPAARK